MRRALLVVAAFAGACGAAAAAEWTFDPALTLSLQHASNPRRAAANRGGDSSGTLDAELRLSRRTARDLFTIAYEPTIERFSDQTDLDNTAHNASFVYTRTESRLFSWGASGGWRRADRQRVDLGALEPAGTLPSLPHTRETSWSGRLDGAWTTSPLTTLSATLDVLKRRNELLDAPAGEPDANDGRTVDLRVGWRRSLSPLSALRVDYRGSRIDEGVFGSSDVHRAYVGYVRGATDRLTLTFELGVAASKPRDVPAGADDARKTRLVGGVVAEGAVGRRARVYASVSRDVSGSGGALGAGVDDAATVSYGLPIGRFSSFDVGGGYTRFKPDAFAAGATPATRAWSGRAQYRLGFSAQWGMVFAAERFDQSSDLAELSYADTRWSVGLRWSPLAR